MSEPVGARAKRVSALQYDPTLSITLTWCNQFNNIILMFILGIYKIQLQFLA